MRWWVGWRWANADQADGNGIGDICEPPPAGQPTGDCCGGGMDGMMMMPMTLLGIGWMRRRRMRRQRSSRLGLETNNEENESC